MPPETDTPTEPNDKSWLRRTAREPLVHFVLLGAAIFGADQALVAWRGDPQEIVVPASARREARDMFVSSMQREPSPDELRRLLDRWLHNEILYREGLLLGLDKGDAAIRERVIFKSLSIAQSGIVLPKIDEPGLRAWFAANRVRYDEPARVDFQEALLSGENTREALERFAEGLNGKGTPATERSTLRLFKDRPRPSIAQAFGDEFARALEAQPAGTWAVQDSKAGPRVVRLEQVVAGRAVAYEDVRDRVFQDWKEETAARLTTEAIRQMGRKYRVRPEASTS